MNSIEIKAQSVDAAIEDGLKELNVAANQVDIEIISKGGIFKKAVVKLTLKTDSVPTAAAAPCTPAVTAESASDGVKIDEAPVVADKPYYRPREADKEVSIDSLTGGDKLCVDFLSTLLKTMQLDCFLKITSSADKLAVLICGADTNTAIGYRGETLDNIQYLTLLVANKITRFRKKLIIDAEGYREKRAETLTELSRKLAYKVAKTHTAVELEPMNAFERRVIHTALQDDKYVTTTSEGSDPYRYIVISPKDGAASVARSESSDYKPRERRDNYAPRAPRAERSDESTTAVAPLEQPTVEDSTPSDIYDQSSKSNFKKSGAGKTRSFGNKQRRF